MCLGVCIHRGLADGLGKTGLFQAALLPLCKTPQCYWHFWENLEFRDLLLMLSYLVTMVPVLVGGGEEQRGRRISWHCRIIFKI